MSHSTLLDSACFTRLESLVPRMVRVAARMTSIWLCFAACALGDDADLQRAKLLEQMRSRADQTKVRLVKDDMPAEFVAKPVFRYDDQPRKFIDATMWVWTRAGRPIAFQKIEAMIDYADKPLWGYCFTSLADELLEVKWAGGREYQSSAAGTEYHLLPSAPAPATKSTDRKRQMREIARDFSARLADAAKTQDSSAMRLLPTPLFEFTDAESKLTIGGVFGFANNGTNPDLLVVLEAVERQGTSQWHFGAARMTNGGLRLHYKEIPIWEVDAVKSQTGRFATWMFFNTPRD